MKSRPGTHGSSTRFFIWTRLLGVAVVVGRSKSLAITEKQKQGIGRPRPRRDRVSLKEMNVLARGMPLAALTYVFNMCT